MEREGGGTGGTVARNQLRACKATAGGDNVGTGAPRRLCERVRGCSGESVHERTCRRIAYDARARALAGRSMRAGMGRKGDTRIVVRRHARSVHRSDWMVGEGTHGARRACGQDGGCSQSRAALGHAQHDAMGRGVGADWRAHPSERKGGGRGRRQPASGRVDAADATHESREGDCGGSECGRGQVWSGDGSTRRRPVGGRHAHDAARLPSMLLEGEGMGMGRSERQRLVPRHGSTGATGRLSARSVRDVCVRGRRGARGGTEGAA